MENFKKIKRICKQCGEEFVPCKKTSEFCSKSCATRYRNIQKIKDGSHNFNYIDRSKIAKDKVEKGTHPFLKGNMTEESLAKKAEGIKNARIREAKEHTHLWQQPKNIIASEFSRSNNIAVKRNLKSIFLYMADTDFEGTFKIGWTESIEMREKDIRPYHLTNFKILKQGTPEEIILLERNIKLKFLNEEYFNKYKSTEIFPIEILNNILEFINSSTTV